MVEPMSGEQRKGWTEQDSADATRLWRVLDERAKRKASERLDSSEKIHEPRHDPSCRDDGPAAKRRGVTALQAAGPTAAGEEVGNGLGKRADLFGDFEGTRRHRSPVSPDETFRNKDRARDTRSGGRK